MPTSERDQQVHIRELRSDNIRAMTIRLVELPDIVGGIDAISTIDVEATVDLDADGTIIGIHLDWNP